MTPIERAGKIVRGEWTVHYCNNCITGNERRKLEELIAAQIEEAEREAFVADRKAHNERVEEVRKEIYAEGFRAAREEAKEIAETVYEWHDFKMSGNRHLAIAQRIGEMEP